MKLDKTDKKILIYGIILGIVLNLFIGKGIEIVMLLETSYFIHKYLDREAFTGNIEFIDKEKYANGLKRLVKIIDIYIITRIVILLIIKMGASVILELLLISRFIEIYNDKLQQKYIKSINGIEIEKSKKLLNNKALTSIILVVFFIFTYRYATDMKSIDFKEDYIDTPNYKYQLSYNEENKRGVALEGNSFEQMAIENEENKSDFERYIKDVKLLLIIDLLEYYSKFAIVFMFVLAFTQMNFREKNKKANTVFVDVFLVGAIVFSIIAFNTYSIDLEYKIMSDYTEHRLY